MRPGSLVGALALHAALVALLSRVEPRAPGRPAREVAIEVIQPPAPMVDRAGPASGPGARGASGPPVARAPTGPRRTRHAAHRLAPSPWADVGIRIEPGGGAGAGWAGAGGGGAGGGGGGGGFGLGAPGRAPIAQPALPPVPAPPPPSRARPARLLYPTREEDVDADALCIAVVTVDEDGDVVGARMVQSPPGSRGEMAANLIWRFRYAPALDDAGRPIRSTFEQPFGVR